jgi:ATP dependent DNA ligase domain
MGRFAERPPERRFDGRNENHPAPQLLRGPIRRRLDRKEVRLQQRCPPARDFDGDDQETGLPSRQEFCRQEIYGRSGEVVTIGILLAFPIYLPCETLHSNRASQHGEPRFPQGRTWIHEIKHDGYRLIVVRDGARVRLFTRNGHDWSDGYPLITEAALRNRNTSFVIDGEAGLLGVDGISDFDGLHSSKHDDEVKFYAFDMLVSDGEDKAQCKLPYVITAGASGGVVMHLADDATPQELRLKGSPGGKNYIGPPGPAGGEKDREVVSVDSRVLITRFVEPDAAKRYGNMVYVRCT